MVWSESYYTKRDAYVEVPVWIRRSDISMPEELSFILSSPNKCGWGLLAISLVILTIPGIVHRWPFPSSRRSCRRAVPEWRYGSWPWSPWHHANAFHQAGSKPPQPDKFPRPGQARPVLDRNQPSRSGSGLADGCAIFWKKIDCLTQQQNYIPYNVMYL